MPAPWPEDDDDDLDGIGAPVHPDDRLWRHPSELTWNRSDGVAPPPNPTGPGAGRLLLVTVTSGVVGAAMALGVLAVNGALDPTGTERVVERVGVRDMLADPLAGEPDLGLADVIAGASPSVVGIVADDADGGATGSGIVLLDDGHIATSARLVGDADTVRIVLPDGTDVVGDVVQVDDITDIAVVVPAGGPERRWTPAVRGGIDGIRVGDATVAVGTAARAGDDPAVALGLVTALDQMMRTSTGWTLHDLIETNMDIEPQVVGGALLDRAGRVIGMVASVDGGDGRVGLSTPIEVAWATVDAVIDGGAVPVWLGIEGSDVELTTTSLTGAIATRAVQVQGVVVGSPADAAGIRDGDLLVTLEGEAIDSMGDLVVSLRAHHPGDAVRIGLLRDGDEVEVGVTLRRGG